MSFSHISTCVLYKCLLLYIKINICIIRDDVSQKCLLSLYDMMYDNNIYYTKVYFLLYKTMYNKKYTLV